MRCLFYFSSFHLLPFPKGKGSGVRSNPHGSRAQRATRPASRREHRRRSGSQAIARRRPSGSPTARPRSLSRPAMMAGMNSGIARIGSSRSPARVRLEIAASNVASAAKPSVPSISEGARRAKSAPKSRLKKQRDEHDGGNLDDRHESECSGELRGVKCGGIDGAERQRAHASVFVLGDHRARRTQHPGETPARPIARRPRRARDRWAADSARTPAPPLSAATARTMRWCSGRCEFRRAGPCAISPQTHPSDQAPIRVRCGARASSRIGSTRPFTI